MQDTWNRAVLVETNSIELCDSLGATRMRWPLFWENSTSVGRADRVGGWVPGPMLRSRVQERLLSPGLTDDSLKLFKTSLHLNHFWKN